MVKEEALILAIEIVPNGSMSFLRTSAISSLNIPDDDLGTQRSLLIIRVIILVTLQGWAQIFTLHYLDDLLQVDLLLLPILLLYQNGPCA